MPRSGGRWRAAKGFAQDALTFKPTKEQTMKFMVMVKATPDSEAGKMPDRKLIEAMMKFN